MNTQSKLEDTEISSTELHAFADDDYYVDKWIRLEQDKIKFAGFNVFAALFGPVWCFFRKLYLIINVPQPSSGAEMASVVFVQPHTPDVATCLQA